MLGHGIGTRYDGLRSNHRRKRRQHHGRKQQRGGKQAIERVFYGARVPHQQGTLTHVVDGQGRQHHAAPGPLYRPLAEVPHVCIQRFGPGKCQHNGADRHKDVPSLFGQKLHGNQWIECFQNGRLLDDFNHTEHCQHRKPHHDDGPEQLADQAGSISLHGKE